MSFNSHKLCLITGLALVVLSLLLTSVCDCLINDQVINSGDPCEVDNHAFLSKQIELNNPDLFTKLQLETSVLPIPITASQVFHPPTVV